MESKYQNGLHINKRRKVLEVNEKLTKATGPASARCRAIPGADTPRWSPWASSPSSSSSLIPAWCRYINSGAIIGVRGFSGPLFFFFFSYQTLHHLSRPLLIRYLTPSTAISMSASLWGPVFTPVLPFSVHLPSILRGSCHLMRPGIFIRHWATFGMDYRLFHTYSTVFAVYLRFIWSSQGKLDMR